MKILLVNTYDRGGAANACLRLHQGLLESEVDSKVLLRFKTKEISQTIQFEPLPVKISTANKITNKAVRILKELKLFKNKKISPEYKFLSDRSSGLEMFSFPKSQFEITESKEYLDSEIINLHWVSNFLDYETFFEKNNKPIVWTLHDMNPFTGGEHYVEEFLGIDEFGFPIKRIKSKEEIKFDKKNIAIKMQALSKVNNLTIVTPSKWLAEEARKSVLFKNKPIFCIPYGLDSEIFAPRDTSNSRELLNIPKNKKVILFVADSIDKYRKGFVFLKRAFKQLKNPNLVLCTIGDKSNELETIENVLELGSINNQILMSNVYSAADVLVVPSLMDNLPNTVLESLMCGTPVIGFPVGGIPDMIQDGVNGFITEEVSVNSLVVTINKFLNNSNYFDEIEIRNNAIKKYDQNIQSQKYINLLEKILNEEINS